MWGIRDVCRWAVATQYDRFWSPGKFGVLIDDLADTLQGINSTTPFDCIAGAGFSGLLVLGALSYKLGIPFIAVRKDGEKAYSADVQGLCFSPRYVIVDDLIETGKTIDTITLGIMKAHNAVLAYGATDDKGELKADAPVPHCVGIVLYGGGSMNGETDYDGIPIVCV